MPITVSDRLKMLKEIANALSREDWASVDVTLREFGLPVEIWNGELKAYVLEMASKASDDVLIDLAKHVGFEIPGVRPSSEENNANAVEEPSFWHTGMLKLFVSHLARERHFAGDLRKCLLHYGISSFVAHDDIEPTKEWQVEIERALATCDTLVALLHKGFHESSWTDQEIGYVMGRGRPTYAVRLGETPYGFIGRFQAFNGTGKTAKQVAADLFDAYRKNPVTKAAMAEICMRRFENSDSFAEAKERILFLESSEIWMDTFNARLSTALKGNSQISGSYGVPMRVRALINRHSAE